MATPLPLVERLSCKSCDNFQGDPSDLDGSTSEPCPTGGWPDTGKCRKGCPEPTLQDTSDPLVANWPTVTQSDVCSFHSAEVGSTHPDDSAGDERGDYSSIYILSPFDRYNFVLGYQSQSVHGESPLRKPSAIQSLLGRSTDGNLKRNYLFAIAEAAVVYTCQTCDFWKSDGAGAGTCRRLAPKPEASVASAVKLAVWTTTQPNDWCSYGVANPSRSTSVIQARTTARKTATPV